MAELSWIRHHKRVTADPDPPPRWPVIAVAGLSLVVVALAVVWVLNAHAINHWLGVYTGATNESGPYYGFWSGFGSDLAELGILGAIGTAIYQLVKKYNCHEPGCWRVGAHPAAGGQFLLCYRHHPDFHGSKPTHDLIVKMHREHEERQAALHEKINEIHRRITAPGADKDDGMRAVPSERPVDNTDQY
jgi:hypothetical protein